MERKFDEELKNLKDKILKLGALVEEQVQNAVNALVKRDSSLAKDVIEKDTQVNRIEVEIDEECIRLIALRQPVGVDLRFITTAMKLVTDLERIGDLAVDICERAMELNLEPQLKPFIDIPRMADISMQMLKGALDAFVNRDSKLAQEVCARDDEVDNLNVQIFRELLTFMVEDSHTISRAVRISYISKYLERVADHATNIAEMVVYLVEGKIIRHMGA
ncbi:MAG: phosphate transport system regulatory protein PhoU [Nitrospirae bacterium RBG_19FT_COMBO_42_15]|nr:MAG: phosphate transport system regulatory protein PhoU [Nitrospirae bacterium RBG_19FT_COMBO_42_15]